MKNKSKEEANAKYLKLKADQERALKQKEDAVKGVLDTVRNKPKFIKLLEYALNSLENYVTPPNRDIKLNSRVIIRENGVDSLKVVASNNMNNDMIITKVGNILSRLIGEPVDKELAQEFMDKAGQDLVIEIVLSKPPSEGSMFYVKLINSLVQVPQLIPKLIESGVVEAVKLINDLYEPYPDIIALNMDTMKKISNYTLGREAFMKKGMISSVLKSVQVAASENNEPTVITGLQVVDNISRTESGLKELNQPKVINQLNSILDKMDSSETVVELGAKIYSKIMTKDDLKAEVEELLKIKEQDLSDKNELKRMEKSLVKISNMMLIDETNEILKTYIGPLKTLFCAVKTIKLDNRSKEELNLIVLSNKYFMRIFSRMINNCDHSEIGDLVDSSFLGTINEALLSIWKNLSSSLNKDALLAKTENGKLFRDYVISAVNVFLKAFSNNHNPTAEDYHHVNNLLEIIKDSSLEMQSDEAYCLAASRLVGLATKFKQDAIIQGIDASKSDNQALLNSIKELRKNNPLVFNPQPLFNFYKNAINVASNGEIVVNLINSLKSYLTEKFDCDEAADFLSTIINTLKDKYLDRTSVESCLSYMKMITSRPQFIAYYDNQQKKEGSKLFGVNLINPVTSAMTKHYYESLTELKAINLNREVFSKLVSKDKESKIEQNIKSSGSDILENLVSDAELKISIAQFKIASNDFKPENYSIDSLTNLDNSLHKFLAFLQNPRLFMESFQDILNETKNLIKKELNFIEKFKKSNDITKKENEEVINSSSKRLAILTGVISTIDSKCQEMIEQTSNTENLSILKTGIKNALECVLEILDRSTDSNSLCKLIKYLKEDVDFLLDNQSDLIDLADQEKMKLKSFGTVQFENSFLEKIIGSLINLLRKNPDNDQIINQILETLISIADKCPEMINFIVKSGCPKLLLQLLETGNREALAKLSLQLIKKIADSNISNLELLSNQDIISKLYDIGINYGASITEFTAPILEHLNKLPSAEMKIQEIVVNTATEIMEYTDDIQNWEFMSTKSGHLLDLLRKLNVFSSSSENLNKQIGYLVENPKFLAHFETILKKILEDSDLSKNKEQLLSNILNLIKKMMDYCKVNAKEYPEKYLPILKTLAGMTIPVTINTHYSPIIEKSSKIVNDYLEAPMTRSSVTSEDIKKMFNEDYVNSLLDILENFLDDPSVVNEINKILSNLCFVSSELSGYILRKGGLKNIIKDLKYLVKSEDSSASMQRLNHLKFINKLINEKNNLKEFVQLGGVEVIDQILAQESKKLNDEIASNFSKDESSNKLANGLSGINEANKTYYPALSNGCKLMTLPVLSNDSDDNEHIPICMEIENQILNAGNQISPKFVKWCLALTKSHYPNFSIIKNHII